jgi:hypothetical protein
VANAGPDQGGKAPGAFVNLNGSQSFDANRDPLTYNWTIVNQPTGSTATLNNPTSVSSTFIIDIAAS